MKDDLSSGILPVMAKRESDPELGERIRYLRKDVLGMGSQEEFADAIEGVSRGAVGNWELGKGIKAENLIKISDRFGVSFKWLATGNDEPPAPRVGTFDRLDSGKVVKFDRQRGEPVKIVTEGGPSLDRNAEMRPIFAAAQGGKGHLIIDTDPVDYGSPPKEVLLSKGSYGVFVVGDSMVPAYEPGDVAWVTPFKPLKAGKHVFLYREEPDGKAEAMIKRLVSFTSKEWRLRQYNPPEEFTESRADWPVCHLIHSKTNA